MNNMLCILIAVLALVTIIDCKVGEEDGANQHDICAVVGCVKEQQLTRTKRANGRAVAILGGVESLVTNIVKASLDGAAKIKAQGRRKKIIIGPGKHNTNKVTINSRHRY